MNSKRKVLSAAGMLLLLPLAGVAANDADLRLLEAARNKDQAAVRSLLSQHANVNATQSDGATALAWAAHWDDLEMADVLIRAGANVNAANRNGVTPLSLACTNANAPMVEKLLQAGANPNAAQWNGETPLMTCVRTGSLEAVRLLLTHNADVNAKENRRGQTVLMWAVSGKHPEMVRELIQRGADVRARSNLGFTSILFAARAGDLESARLLVAAGADVNDATPDGLTALLISSSSGHEALSVYLVENGANPNVADVHGMTPLHFAVLRGLSSTRTGVLLSRSKALFLQHSPLFRPNMLPLLKVLLAHGANPNPRILTEPPKVSPITNPRIKLDGATPFFLAAATDDVAVMQALLEGGADPTITTNDKTTPLMVAAGVGQVEDRPEEELNRALGAVKMLVELGADVNAANATGLRALHGAASTGANEVIQFLVEKGAKLDVRDRLGQTPLSIAEGDPARLVLDRDRPRVHKSTAELLLKLGAPPLDAPIAQSSTAAPAAAK